MSTGKKFLSALLTLVILCGIGAAAPSSPAIISYAAEQPGEPYLSLASGDFDKDARADITFDIDWGEDALGADGIAGVSCGGQALAYGDDYTVSGNTLTVKKEYLFAQTLGTKTLDITFNNAESTLCSREIRVFFDAQVWVTTLHPWLRFHPNGALTINNQAAYDDFAEFLSDTSNWEYVAENIDAIEFLAVTTTSIIMSDGLVTRFCDMVKSVNAKRAESGRKNLQISFQAGGILAYAGAGEKGSYEEAYYWFEKGASEGLVSAIPRMKAQGVYADYIHLDGTISRATGNQAAASGNNPSPDCPVMTREQAIGEIIHLMQIYRDYYADVGHDVKFIYLFNFPNHGWKGGRAVTLNGSGFSDAYSDMVALSGAAIAAKMPLLGFTLDAPYNYMNRNGIDLMGRCLDFEAEAHALGYTAGIVFNTEPDGVKGDTSEYYYKESLKFIEEYESKGGKPDIYHSMSWYNTAPSSHLPESKPHTLTYQAKAFIEHVKFGVPSFNLGDPGWFYAVSRANDFWRCIMNIFKFSPTWKEYQKVEVNYFAREGVAVEYYAGEKGLAPTEIADEDWTPYTDPFYIYPGFFFGLINPKTVYVKITDGVNPPMYTSK